MDLKSKRIFGISQIVICMAMLLLYTRIGSIGTVYVAITLEIVLGPVLLFLGSPTTNKTYCIVSTILIEGCLLLIYHLWVIPSEIMFVGTFLKFYMFLVPLYAILQWAKGVLQAVLEPQISAITDLVFWIATVLGAFLSYLISGNYGLKVADLMQSVKLEHFYVILCLLPGFVLGHIVAFLFLFWVGHRYKKEVLTCIRQASFSKKNLVSLCLSTFKEQFLDNLILIAQRMPVWILLCLSIKEIKTDNYLFGHLYGAILPLYGLVWHIFSIALINYKKRLFILTRKRLFDQYQHELNVVLSYVLVYSIYFMVCIFALHKSYLAIWSLQTSTSFMGLMKASSLIALLGFPYNACIDIMSERNLKNECSLSVVFGVFFSAITAAICNKFLGAGSALYILSLSFGLFVSVFLFCWFMRNEIGINYIDVLKKTYKAIVLNVFLCLILIIIENLIFTAFGGLGTLVICFLFSYVFLRLGIFCLRIFSKEERQKLSFKANIKAILGISGQVE